MVEVLGAVTAAQLIPAPPDVNNDFMLEVLYVHLLFNANKSANFMTSWEHFHNNFIQ